MHHICPDCGSDPCICNINDTEHNIINICDDEDYDVCPVCHKNPCECDECDSMTEDTIIDVDDIATCPICHHDPCECDCAPDNDLYESDDECPICHSNPCICDIEERDECNDTFYEDDSDTCECDCDDLDESYIVEETDNQSINMIYDYVTKVANYCAHVGKRISKDDPDFDKYKKACNAVNKCLTDLAGILS